MNYCETQANDHFKEEFYEAYCESMDHDCELRDELAYKVLEPLEHYLYCKEDAYHYMTENEEVYEKLYEAAQDSEGCLDMRALVEKAYGIEV